MYIYIYINIYIYIYIYIYMFGLTPSPEHLTQQEHKGIRKGNQEGVVSQEGASATGLISALMSVQWAKLPPG